MPKEKTMQALVRAERKNITETLAAGGHVLVDENTAEPLDWIRSLMDTNADIALECRYDLSDPETSAALRRRLAKMVAICQAWDNQLC
jgi:hypothetical protein